jgi:hypothetical protein
MNRAKGTKLSDRRPERDILRYFMEAFAQSAAERDAAAMVNIVYKRAIETDEPISPELKQYLADQLQGGPANPASKLLDAIPVIKGAKKRVGRITTCNDKRQRKAEGNKQTYRDIAGALIAEKPNLRRATRHRLADAVRTELSKRMGKPPSVRTIERAFGPKNKV